MKSLCLNLVIFLMCFAHNLTAQNDAITQFFGQYKNDERFTSVEISPKLFSMVSKLDIEFDEEDELIIKEALNSLKGIKVLVLEDNDGRSFYKEALNKINFTANNGYEPLMTVRDKDENVHIVIKENNNKISELLLVVGGEDEFVLLSLMGDIDLDRIAKLSKKMDIKGAKHLEKVEGKH